MRRLLVLLAAFTVLAAACGGSPDTDATTEDPPTTTATSTSATSSTTAPPTTTAAPTTTSTTTIVEAELEIDPDAARAPAPEVSTVVELIALDRPIVAGHAGGDRSYPHSTMYGFVEAALAGADVLELDVQLTADRHLIVQHDDTVDATTETTGRVRDLTFDEINALDNAYWWSDEWRSQSEPDTAYVWRGVRTGDVEPPEGYTAEDFAVVSFQDVQAAFPDHVLDIEIKVPRGVDDEPDLAFAIEGAGVLADEIAILDLTDRVIVTSFSVEVMEAFRELAPEVATSPSEAETFAWYLGTGTIHPNDVVAQVPPTFGDIDVLAPDIVERVKAEGLEMWIWPNDSDAQENADFYAQVIALGADGIIAAGRRWRSSATAPTA